MIFFNIVIQPTVKFLEAAVVSSRICLADSAVLIPFGKPEAVMQCSIRFTSSKDVKFVRTLPVKCYANDRSV